MSNPRAFIAAVCLLLATCAAKDGYLHDEQVLLLSLKTCELQSCSDAERGWRLHRLAWYYQLEKNYSKAEAYAKESIAFREKAFGRNAPATATSMDNLGTIYSTQGKFDVAYKMHEEACAIYRSAGTTPIDEAMCLNNLAWVLEHQGLLGEAEARYLEAGQIFARVGISRDDSRYKTLTDNLDRCRARGQGAADANVTRPVRR